MQDQESCNRWHRCRQYRTCLPCARLRQAHIADVAEELLSKYTAVYPARITPFQNTEAEIRRLKEAIKRRLGDSDAVWTIEQGGEKKLLHINLISPVQFIKGFKQAEYWQGEVIKNLRQAAAYILKQSQIPDQSAYSGRQHGTFKSMSDLYTAAGQAPIIQAAAAEKITLKEWVLPEPYVARQKEIARIRAENRSYAQIADDHLPKFRAYIASIKGTNK